MYMTSLQLVFRYIVGIRLLGCEPGEDSLPVHLLRHQLTAGPLHLPPACRQEQAQSPLVVARLLLWRSG